VTVRKAGSVPNFQNVQISPVESVHFFFCVLCTLPKFFSAPKKVLTDRKNHDKLLVEGVVAPENKQPKPHTEKRNDEANGKNRFCCGVRLDNAKIT
jgi:hypothetical protein